MSKNPIVRRSVLATAISDIVDQRPTDLKPWPTNPRHHSPKQITALKAGIRKFGFTNPVLVDENGVILSGHGRVLAAIQLGLPVVPTRVIQGLTTSDKRAYLLADNKLALMSTWDTGLLQEELGLLIKEDFEIEVTGFSTAELDLMFVEPGAQAADELASSDLVMSPVSRLGDVWQLGEHRLVCGNALSAETYAALMQGDLAQFCITDPPYNVPIQGHVTGSGRHQHREFVMASGEMSPSQFTDFLRAAFEQMRAHSIPGAINCAFMDWRHLPEILTAGGQVFGAMLQLCVWAKENAGMGSFYRSQHELVCIFKNGDAPHINNFELGQHGRYRTNVWSYPGATSATGRKLLELHPTVKPVAMIADALRDCSHRRGIVLDPFAGSGTILVAAERCGRRARAIELEPRYVDVAVQRWQRVTGKHAVLRSTGDRWLDVQAARATSASRGAA